MAVLFGALSSQGMEAFSVFPSVEKHMVETGMEVHQWLTQEAWRYFESQIAGAELDNYIGTWGVDGIYFDTRRSTVIDGTRDADKGFKPPLWQGVENAIFDLDSPSLRHFCASGKDIYTGLYVIYHFDSNLTQAQNVWKDNESDNLLLRWNQSDKTTAYYYLGHVAHLIQDMTVPAHTHNDPHGSNLPSLHDSYEQDFAASHFKEYRYDDAIGLQYVLKNSPITIPASLLEAFQKTADYTDDYDSNHADGEYARSGLAACSFPTDYPSALLHRPADALRTGGGDTSIVSDDKCAIIANDLMYWAVRRTAQLFRFFYQVVDSADFHAEIRLADQDIVLSADENAAVPYLGPKLAGLHVSYSTRTHTDFPPSGIVKDSCVFHYEYKPDGGEWAGEQSLPFPTGAGALSLPTEPGLYRAWVTAENGGGKQAEPVYGYFRAQGFALVQAPRGGTVETAGALSLHVKVSGAGDGVTYLWQKDGQTIPGADTDTYMVAIVGYGDAGRYTCIITDPVQGTITTPVAMVNVVAENRLPASGTTFLLVEMSLMLGLGTLCLARRQSGSIFPLSKWRTRVA